jgi:hypothetical protein
MSRFRIGLVAASAVALGLVLSAPANAAAPGTPCGANMVVNTHGQCVQLGSFCQFSDGMVLGTIGGDGRCVIPGTNI